MRITNHDGSSTVARRFGVVAVHPGSANTQVRITSFGFQTAAGASVIGFGRTDLVTATPGTCELVLWNPSAEAAAAFRNLLGKDIDLCAELEQ